MIEVFKTNVTNKVDAAIIIAHIHQHFTSYVANFDLQDCDHILRIKSVNGRVKATSLIKMVNGFGFHAEVLPEQNSLITMTSESLENQ